MNGYSRVLVPVDFSDESIDAVDKALGIAAEPSGVFVLHVLPELSASEPGMVWESIDAESRRRHATEALQDRLGDSKYQGVHLAIKIGDAGHCIADHAQHVKADIIVMPSHGRRGFKRLLLGSVAERVLRLADCSVLILKKPR